MVVAVVAWPLVPVGRLACTTPSIRSVARLPRVARDRAREAESCWTWPLLPTHTVIGTEVLPSCCRIWETLAPSLEDVVSPAREASSDKITVVEYSVVGVPCRSTCPTVVTWPPMVDRRPSSCDGLASTANVDESALADEVSFGSVTFSQDDPPVSEDTAGEPR